MATIGYVDLPTNCYTRRSSGSVNGRPGIVELPLATDKAYYVGNDLPRYSYEGFCQSGTAHLTMKALREQFRNHELDEPLYINLDRRFFCLVEDYSYEQIGGYRNLFRFKLDVIWLGTQPFLTRQYKSEDYTTVENSWGI